MNKTLVFDMDGTLNLFYNVDGWLENLQNSNPRPYLICEPKVDIDLLNTICDRLRDKGWKVVITSWLSKNSTLDFDNEVRKAKIEWLKKVNFKYDEIHLVKYGTTKANCTRKYQGVQILVDDNEKVRKGFENGVNRFSINANQNYLNDLMSILDKDF